MNATDRDVWSHLEAVHAGDLPLPAFEQWLYGAPEVEAVLGPDAWLELSARDYAARLGLHDTRQQVERLYAARRPGRLAPDRARRVAHEFLDGRRDLWSTCRHLARLRAEGHDAWVPVAFVGIDSELDAVPAPGARGEWDPVALRRVLGRSAPWLDWAHREARDAARAMLEVLDAGAPGAVDDIGNAVV